jgi:hypothetical protein
VSAKYHEIICTRCGGKGRRATGELNRARRQNKALYCSQQCAFAARTELLNEAPWPVCSVDNCGTPARSRHATMCDTHYCQIRRNGHLGPMKRPDRIDHSQGYQLLMAPRHPLIAPRGHTPRVYEQRAVFYEHHGKGPFPCHFCGTEQDWTSVHIARLDDDKENNDIGNLVASCPGCHLRRHHRKAIITRRQRSSPMVEWNGRRQTIADWAEELGFSNLVLLMRYKRGWTVERMLTEPVNKPLASMSLVSHKSS